MSIPESVAEFTLYIFSSQPVEVIKLEDSKNAVVPGKWTDKSAGGSHLNAAPFEQNPEKLTWVNNPKYRLILKTKEEVKVKIVLSRPEKAWKKMVGINLVGCMIGFYVFPANQPLTKESARNRDGQ